MHDFTSHCVGTTNVHKLYRYSTLTEMLVLKMSSPDASRDVSRHKTCRAHLLKNMNVAATTEGELVETHTAKSNCQTATVSCQ